MKATNGLAPGDANTIRAWLAAIGEHDPQTINEVLTTCAADDEALEYYLARTREITQ